MKEVLLRFQIVQLHGMEQPDAFIWTRAQLEGVPLPKVTWLELAHLMSPESREGNWKEATTQAGIQLDRWNTEDGRQMCWRFRWEPRPEAAPCT